MHIQPSLDEIGTLRDQGNLCPIYAEVLADLETPVSAFLKVARGPYSFLLESVEGGQHIARYSFIGAEPYLALRFEGGVASAVQGGYKQTLPYRDPLALLQSYLADYRPVRLPDLPRFVGGAVGYLSYDAVDYFERLPRPQRRSYEIPDGVWQFVDTLLVFDHLRHKIKVISHVHLDAADLEAEYRRATERIGELIARLNAPVPPDAVLQFPGVPAGVPSADAFRADYDPWPDEEAPHGMAARPVSNISLEEYAHRVEAAQEYIAAGDIFQVVPSQRFSRRVRAHPFTIYRALRTINPSPYMFYLHTPDCDLVGSSPELLVRVEDRKVTTHPIAGTRRRGRDVAEDSALAEELHGDEKERAEHLMLVDLGRNDIGRVAEAGSVSVPVFMTVEKFSHVMHLVSHVTGTLRSDLTALDALRSCFPAGTVSGAPKIRAMQIIADLESTTR
ncbi:MAG TPA: chorismate-binding protein, partial [Roseiflexaceae bacterium]|nr:chorismate-binding protein [Roseiflexaceae bacterium]